MIEFQEDLESALLVLKAGGSILYPTDTVWGLGCDATSVEAVDGLFALKQRPAAKSMIVLVADERDILRYVSNLDMQIFGYLDTVQRPTTVIYEGAIGLAENAVNEDGTVAIRIVKDTFCRHLIKRFRKPIVSTSANISGRPFAGSFTDIEQEIRQGVDYVVKYRQDEIMSSEPSSIVKWHRGEVQVIR